jgi:hypothetical protein
VGKEKLKRKTFQIGRLVSTRASRSACACFFGSHATTLSLFILAIKRARASQREKKISHSPNPITMSEDPNRSTSFLLTHGIPSVLPLILLLTLADGGLSAHTITTHLNVVNPKTSFSRYKMRSLPFVSCDVLARRACVVIDGFFLNNRHPSVRETKMTKFITIDTHL